MVHQDKRLHTELMKKQYYPAAGNDSSLHKTIIYRKFYEYSIQNHMDILPMEGMLQ